MTLKIIKTENMPESLKEVTDSGSFDFVLTQFLVKDAESLIAYLNSSSNKDVLIINNKSSEEAWSKLLKPIEQLIGTITIITSVDLPQSLVNRGFLQYHTHPKDALFEEHLPAINYLNAIATRNAVELLESLSISLDITKKTLLYYLDKICVNPYSADPIAFMDQKTANLLIRSISDSKCDKSSLLHIGMVFVT